MSQPFPENMVTKEFLLQYKFSRISEGSLKKNDYVTVYS